MTERMTTAKSEMMKLEKQTSELLRYTEGMTSHIPAPGPESADDWLHDGDVVGEKRREDAMRCDANGGGEPVDMTAEEIRRDEGGEGATAMEA